MASEETGNGGPEGAGGQEVIDRVFKVIESRRGGDTTTSYVARLFDKGPERIAKKLGEEAVETVMAGVDKNRDVLIAESTDLVFHLLVLWAALDIRPGDIFAEFERREGVSGIEGEAAKRDTDD